MKSLRIKLKDPKSKEADDERKRVASERKRAYRHKKLEGMSAEEKSVYWKKESSRTTAIRDSGLKKAGAKESYLGKEKARKGWRGRGRGVMMGIVMI